MFHVKHEIDFCFTIYYNHDVLTQHPNNISKNMLTIQHPGKMNKIWTGSLLTEQFCSFFQVAKAQSASDHRPRGMSSIPSLGRWTVTLCQRFSALEKRPKFRRKSCSPDNSIHFSGWPSRETSLSSDNMKSVAFKSQSPEQLPNL